MTLFVPKINSSEMQVWACTITDANSEIPIPSIITAFINRKVRFNPNFSKSNICYSNLAEYLKSKISL